MNNEMMAEYVQKLRKTKVAFKLAIVNESDIKKQTGKITAKCRECGYNTENIDEIDKHVVTDKGDHICPGCGNLLIVTQY